MEFFKTFKKFSIIYVSLVTFFFLSLVLVSLIPSDLVRNNIKQSVPLFIEEGDYPRVAGKHKINQLDNYADSVMLNIIYNIDENRPVESVLRSEFYQLGPDGSMENLRVTSLKALVDDNLEPNVQYTRYWHGYIIIVRPLLVFLDYGSIRKVMQIVFYLLFSIIIILLSKKVSVVSAIAFSISMILINFMVIPLTIHASLIFFIMFIFLIILLLFPNISIKEAAFLFFIVGAFTSFMDLLTAPLVTFGIPAVTLLLLRRKRETNILIKDYFLFLVWVSISWALGYALLWVTKWILASLVLKENIIIDGINAVTFRISNEVPFGQKLEINAIDAIIRNFQTLYTYTITNFPIIYFALPSLIFVLLIFIFWHRKLADLLFPFVLVIISLSPYIWFAFASNHSYIHHWFTCRIQAITIFSFIIAFYYSINWLKIDSDIHRMRSSLKSLSTNRRLINRIN